MDIGDFGLGSNGILPEITRKLNIEFTEALTALHPIYRDHIISYTQRRLEWKHNRWGTLHPEQLTNVSTASRFEVMMLDKLTGEFIRPGERFTLTVSSVAWKPIGPQGPRQISPSIMSSPAVRPPGY